MRGGGGGAQEREGRSTLQIGGVGMARKGRGEREGGWYISGKGRGH